MAPQTRSGRGEVGKSVAKKTSSSAIGGGGKGKVTRSSTIGGGGKGKVTRSAIGGGGRKGKDTTSIAIGGGEKAIPTWRATKKLVLRDDSDDSSYDPSSPVARPGRTCQDTYHEALVDLIERNRDVEKTFSQQIGKYAAMRLIDTARILIQLHSLKDWDRRVVEFVLGLIGDLKDIELTVLQFQAISALGDCFFRAPQGGPELVIGESMKKLVR